MYATFKCPSVRHCTIQNVLESQYFVLIHPLNQANKRLFYIQEIAIFSPTVFKDFRAAYV